MRAIVRRAFGGPEMLTVEEYPEPAPSPGHVVIEVKAFGVNRAETYMRRGLWDHAATVSGIECVGLVKSCPDGRFAAGTKVAAMMGGLGRLMDGTYAEVTRALATNVVPIQTGLPWAEFAAIPESYATAWTCLFGNLELAAGQTLVIRGATSALGQAALNIAADAGVHVIGTTRNRSRFPLLEALGAKRAEVEGVDLSERLPERKRIDAVLDLVGNSTLLDSLALVRRGGRVCQAGFLGGLEPVSLNPLRQMPSGVHFSFFVSFGFGTPDYPLSAIPLQTIVDRVASGRYKAKPARVFRFEEVGDAHRLMESNQAGGKMVVTV